MIYYIGDTHFGHKNIIKFCNRPFGSVDEMDVAMVQAIRLLDREHNRLIHAGDLTFNPSQFHRRFGELAYPENNVLVMGNHDRARDAQELRKLNSWFGTVVGTAATWAINRYWVQDKLPGRVVKVMVSHLPQVDLLGADYNVYGHWHNNLFTQPEREEESKWLWVLKDPRYLNAGAEITQYRPMSLADLIEANEEALTRVW